MATSRATTLPPDDAALGTGFWEAFLNACLHDDRAAAQGFVSVLIRANSHHGDQAATSGH